MFSKESPQNLRPVALRVLWAWPLGLGLIGGIEVFTQSLRQNSSIAASFLAFVTVVSSGLWLGLLWSLLAKSQSVHRFFDPLLRWLRRSETQFLTVVSGASLLSLMIPFLVWLFLQLQQQNHFDFGEEELRLLQGLGLLVAVPALGLIFAFFYFWQLWMTAHARWSKVLFLIFVMVTSAHFSNGQFAVFLGQVTGWVLWPMASLSIGFFLPGQISINTRLRPVVWSLPLWIFGFGIVGLHNPSSRALIFEEARVSPPLIRFFWTTFDWDRDDDLPTWLGGGDCDNWDPQRNSAFVEIPGNGVDDNCFAGDAQKPPTGPYQGTLQQRLPIFVITLDAVRADHLDLYGYSRSTMPLLKQAAKRARWYRQAYSPSNTTMYSMPPLWTGQSNERMLADHRDSLTGLNFGFWLPHFLSQFGYQSVAICPPIFVIFEAERQGFGFDQHEQGQRDYVENDQGTASKQLVDQAIAWMDQRDSKKPLLMWLHFYDAHAPHVAFPRFNDLNSRDAYDSELVWIDKQLDRFFHRIHDEFGDQALIVVTADHGEQFNEFGAYGHGFSLREVETRVPLLLWGPSLSPGPVDTPVSSIGLVPTILEQLGLSIPGLFSYPSLVAAPQNLPPPLVEQPEYLWAERSMSVAIRVGANKLIWNRRDNALQLFQLEKDPTEQVNLVGQQPVLRDALFLQLRQALELGR